MLTAIDYEKSMNVYEQLKYNINYDRSILFNIVYVSLAKRLLNHDYSVNLTEEQIDKLTKITLK